MKKILPLRLKIAREKTGWTQEQVSEKLSISIGTLSGYERGYRSPNPEMLAKLASLYGVLVDWLVGNSDDPTPPQIAKKEPSHEEYVLSAPALPEALTRIAEILKRGEIDIERADYISDLVFNKFGKPGKVKTDEAAHNEINSPATGILDDSNEESKNGKHRQ